MRTYYTGMSWNFLQAFSQKSFILEAYKETQTAIIKTATLKVFSTQRTLKNFKQISYSESFKDEIEKRPSAAWAYVGGSYMHVPLRHSLMHVKAVIVRIFQERCFLVMLIFF